MAKFEVGEGGERFIGGGAISKAAMPGRRRGEYVSGESGSAGKERELATENGAERPRERPADAAYWLIARHENGQTEVLTTDLAGNKKVLPVFSYGEEAEMFLGLGGFGEGWQVKKSTAGDLVSVLFGPCLNVGRVALDPLPETVAKTRANLFVSLDRERFVARLIDKASIRLHDPVGELS